jgi:hypothetical protein
MGFDFELFEWTPNWPVGFVVTHLVVKSEVFAVAAVVVVVVVVWEPNFQPLLSLISPVAAVGFVVAVELAVVVEPVADVVVEHFVDSVVVVVAVSAVIKFLKYNKKN